SGLGRRLYFPKGILSQSAEAKAKAHRFNATIGIATEGGGPMHLASIAAHLRDVAPEEAFPYAPPAGQPALRERWREKMLAENPSLRGKSFGLPVVTSAITHGLALVGDLFVDPGDVLVLPDKLWGNYRLTYEVRLGARIATYPFYAGTGFDVASFAAALQRSAEGREKLIALLNFPNNPTGYMPNEAEGEAIVEALLRQAERGTRLLVVLDDAYFGLFYHLGEPSRTESLFASLTNLHPNLLALRLDGATKELFVWGLRCGFLTVGPGRADTAEAVCAVLDAKLRGAIRGGISNVSQLSQSLVRKALESSTLEQERKDKHETLRARAEAVHRVVHAERFRDSWDVYPFNSGYFMCLRAKGVEAEAVRVELLERHGSGVIAAGGSDLRIAFSCLELEQVEPLFESVHAAIQALR
ncbi:MAG: aminotransferase class I/II-fold pyridoxal phosphate-dependent enzyme, partial [Myxococcales bacterium]|nr:aminotransferase class I/II-fold pyridoxal phosphate-dependent enzyme [Myxococcales bacterium]